VVDAARDVVSAIGRAVVDHDPTALAAAVVNAVARPALHALDGASVETVSVVRVQPPGGHAAVAFNVVVRGTLAVEDGKPSVRGVSLTFTPAVAPTRG